MEIPTDRDVSHAVCVGQHLRGSFPTPVWRHIIHSTCESHSVSDVLVQPYPWAEKACGDLEAITSTHARDAFLSLPIHPSILRIPIPLPPFPPQSPQQTLSPPTPPERKSTPATPNPHSPANLNLTPTRQPTSPSLANQPHPHPPTNLTPTRRPTSPPPASQPHPHSANPTRDAKNPHKRPAGISAAKPQCKAGMHTEPKKPHNNTICQNAVPEKASVGRWWGAGWRAEEGREGEGREGGVWTASA